MSKRADKSSNSVKTKRAATKSIELRDRKNANRGRASNGKENTYKLLQIARQYWKIRYEKGVETFNK